MELDNFEPANEEEHAMSQSTVDPTEQLTEDAD